MVHQTIIDAKLVQN